MTRLGLRGQGLFCYKKEELGYFLDTFMGAALYFCSIFDGREKSTEMFCDFFYVLLGFFCCFVLFLKGGAVAYVAGSQTGLFPHPSVTKFAFNCS